jgi:hypothetical protein
MGSDLGHRSPAELIDDDTVVADDVWGEQIALLVLDVGEQRGAELDEPLCEAALAVRDLPTTEALELRALTRVLEAQRLRALGPERQIVVKDGKNEGLLVSQVLNEDLAHARHQGGQRASRGSAGRREAPHVVEPCEQELAQLEVLFEDATSNRGCRLARVLPSFIATAHSKSPCFAPCSCMEWAGGAALEAAPLGEREP